MEMTEFLSVGCSSGSRLHRASSDEKCTAGSRPSSALELSDEGLKSQHKLVDYFVSLAVLLGCGVFGGFFLLSLVICVYETTVTFCSADTGTRLVERHPIALS